MGKNKNKKKNTTSEETAKTDDLAMEESLPEEVPNDGVKLLEEVFGAKASVTSTGPSDESSSESTEAQAPAMEEPKKEPE